MGENIVVVWVGPTPDDCDPTSCEHDEDCPSGICSGGTCLAPGNRIYVRQFQWDGGGPVAYAPQFTADEPTSQPVSIDDANPTVSMEWGATPTEYIIAWNAQELNGSRSNVHGRYFDFNTVQPLGHEFRINVATDETATSEHIRRLGNSAQHTVVYDPEGRIDAVWTASVDSSAKAVWFTQLPSGYAQQRCCAQACCRGDMTGNGVVNGDDTEDFLKAWLNAEGIAGPEEPCLGWFDLCTLDIDGDCIFTHDDLDAYTCLLLYWPDYAHCTSCTVSNCGGGMAAAMMESDAATPAPGSLAARLAARLGVGDCNDDGVPDTDDISYGFSQDCNSNGKPDECDVSFSTSTFDCNKNLIPDECEDGVDCPDWIDLQAGGGSLAESAFADFRAWLHALDVSGMKPYELGCRMKWKLAELGLRYRN